MTHHTTVGVFDHRLTALDAVQALRQAGFADSQIGMISRDDGATSNYRDPVTGGPHSGLPGDPTHTRWEEGSGVGAAAGAAAGTGLGLAVAAGLIPGIGPVIAGGALVALLASAGAGATVGTILGALVGLGIPEDEAELYRGDVTGGKTLVTVAAPGQLVEANDVLRRYGGAVRAQPVGA